MELDLLHLVSNRALYYRFQPYIKEYVMSHEAMLIYNSMELFFKTSKEDNIDWSAFQSFFFVLRNSEIPLPERAKYKLILDNIKAHTPTAGADILMRHFVTKNYSTQIVDAGIKVNEGRATIADIADLIQKHDKELEVAVKGSDLFVSDDLSTILARSTGAGYEWRLEELNISCGPVRQGDFILIAAYVGAGKTTMAASEITHMAAQIKDNRPVVWVNNEEESHKVKMRIMQSALGVPYSYIASDLAKAKLEYDTMMGMPKRIEVTHNDVSTYTVHKLSALFEQINPAIIVFDQLDKVKGFEKESDGKEYERLGRLYKWARELSHKYGPVFAITQADGSADGSKYIRMNQLRGSKVDKPAEADLIITIGKVDDPLHKHSRFIHVPKNKLVGGSRSIEAEREGYWEVTIKPEIARYATNK